MGRDLRVLIIGKGAREHVISEAYEKDENVGQIIVAPGNDLIVYRRKKEVIIDGDCSLRDPNSILSIAKKYKPDLVDVASDNAIGSGSVDLLKGQGFPVFAPNKRAARLEYDKIFAKSFMRGYLIPSAHFQAFNDTNEGIAHARRIYSENPRKLMFVKAFGLCDGKGALDSLDLEEAILNIHRMSGFGESGRRFIIEDGLEGEELSLFVISDGDSYKVISCAVDYKRLNDSDKGPQTGGMGSFSPIDLSKTSKESIDLILEGTFGGFKKSDIIYKGILYFGLIKTPEGLRLIEYNARWGDPEAQVVLPGISNYLEVVESCIAGNLGSVDIKSDSKSRVCVVGASKGYPNDHSKVDGKEIFGLEEIMRLPGVSVYGAGVKIMDGRFYADGGRLFSVVGKGDNLTDAGNISYDAIERTRIDSQNLHFRTDVGYASHML